MKRRTVHLTFGVVALAFASLATVSGLKWRDAQRVNAAIAGAGQIDAASDRAEARFMRAMTLAKTGDYEGALKAYRALGRDAPEELATAALYNVGNLQLREALKAGPDAAIRSLPLIELSKQSYRAALRREPRNWDTRYNLERALWLAPEIEESSVDRIRRDAEERVMSTLQSTRADLP